MPVAVTPPSTGICTSGQLAAAVLEHSGAAGTIYAAIRLSNTSPISCTLSGFPEITGISTDGSPIALQENNSDGPQSPFAIYGTFPLVATLPPHGEGAFVLAYTDVPEGSSTCIQLMRLTVAPPSGGGTLQVSFPATLCSTVISVSPVKVGLSFLSP